MAILAVSAMNVFAQEDALKEILKSKDYKTAESAVKTNLSSFGDEQKAKAYNKLVTLAMDKVHKEEATINENQVRLQLQQGEAQPYDTLGYYEAIYLAIKNAMSCFDCDSKPNAKGKISPKFLKNKELWKYRVHLINAGQMAGTNDNKKDAFKYYSLYVDSYFSNLFPEEDKIKEPDPYLGEVARVAAVYAFQDKDMDNAHKYCDVALGDKEAHQEALNLKMYIIQSTCKTHEDSLKCLKQFEDIYAKDKTDEQVFTNLANMYGGLNMVDDQKRIISEKLQQDPKCFSALVLLGQNYMTEGKYDEAIDNLKKATEVNDKNALVYTFIGFCLNAKASGLESLDAQKNVYKESEKYLEKARDLDPDVQEAKWPYPLYQCYYSLYGPDDERVKEVEKLVKIQ